VNRGDQSKRPR